MSDKLQRVRFLAFIPGLLRELGVNPADVLIESNLPGDGLDDAEGMISFASVARLIQACVDNTGCHHFGLLMGRRAAGAHSPESIRKMMSHAPTFGAALRDLVKRQDSDETGATIYLLRQGEHQLCGFAIYQSAHEAAAQLYDGAAALAYGIMRKAMSTEDISGTQVCLLRKEPSKIEPYRDCLGSDIQFEATYAGIRVPNALLARLIPENGSHQREQIQPQAREYRDESESDFVGRLRRTLRAMLLTGELGRDNLAARLGISGRTLNRRLKARGLGFQQMLDEARFESARHLLLNTQMDVGAIGTILRYSEPAAFTRAFRRWSGASPSKWQQKSFNS